MENHSSLGRQILHARHSMKLTQVELANKCHLNVRTIQRIENDEIRPRLYTLRIIGEALGIELINERTGENEDHQLRELRKIFRVRKQIRLFTFAFGMLLLITAAVLLAFGVPKHVWAPLFYILFFMDLIVIGLTWRCPGCNGLLGDVFNIRYCSKCGLEFFDEPGNKSDLPE